MQFIIICTGCACCAGCITSRMTVNLQALSTALFVLSLLLGVGLILSIPHLQQMKQQSQMLDPNQSPCSQLCGWYSREEINSGSCCWDLISQCLAKKECQQKVQSAYSYTIIVGYIILCLSIVYSIAFLIAMTVLLVRRYKQKKKEIHHPLMADTGPSIGSIIRESELTGTTQDFFHHQDNKPVCLTCFGDLNSRPAIQLQCAHTFHAECVNDWAGNRKVCPFCKGKN